MSDPAADLDATALIHRSGRWLAAAIRRGEVASEAVVRAHVDRLRAFQPVTNALVHARFADALREARAVDDRVRAAQPDEALPPLLGVPFTVKDSVAVEGLPNAGGLVARRDLRARVTAPVARRLLDAGAILLGTTNMSEMGMWFETDNRLHGRTSNPYDPTRIAGGSSGGEGAAVGCGGSPFGIGSDIGGSIRIPAFCCGVFGHKPSPDLVPDDDVWPPPPGTAAELFTNGPLARRAEDLPLLLRLLSADSPRLGDPAEVDLAGLRVVLSESAFVTRIDPVLLAAREHAAKVLAARGARVERVALPSLRTAYDAYVAMLSDSGNARLVDVLAAEGIAPPRWRELARRDSDHTVPTRLLLGLQRLQALLPDGLTRSAMRRGRRVTRDLIGAIGDGVLLHPPFPGLAPRHGRTVGRPWWHHPMVVFNLARLPVTQVPLGLDPASGLPTGVQVVAGRRRDHVALAVAQALEEAFGGWVPPKVPGRSRQ